MKILDKTTGALETVDKDTDVATLSRLRRQVGSELKQLQAQFKEIDTHIQPHIEKALEDGQEILEGYWDIQRGKRAFYKGYFEEHGTEKDKVLYKTRQEALKEIESRYMSYGRPHLKFPRLER